MKWLVRILIRGYQRVISPIIHAIGGPGSGCRFTPTCSEYFLQAVETHGFFKGSAMGTWRILRCNPWGGTGHDPVPAKGLITKGTCSCHGQQGAPSSHSTSSSVPPDEARRACSDED